MKLLISLVFSCAMLQALALPRFENPGAPESIPKADEGLEQVPINDVVENFRTNIDLWFVRFQTFYDRSNAAMRFYRFEHVNLVTSIYNQLMSAMGDDIEAVIYLTQELTSMIENRQTELGGNNPCLQTISDEQALLSIRVGSNVQQCALYANTTLSGLLQDAFYPTFADIQNTLSTVPISVIDVLSRGNVLQDEEAIIEYLRSRYEVIEIQWLGAVSQLLRWESNRFETAGSFLIDESVICLANALMDFIIANAGLEIRVRAC